MAGWYLMPHKYHLALHFWCIYTKRYTLTLIQMPSLCILGLMHSRPNPVPQIHLKTFKMELSHLVRIGVLASQQESEWVSPSFIIPKKDGRVRRISNLRQLNKVIRRKQYPLPIILDILHKRSGYKFFTNLDDTMQYYTFELDKVSQDLCTIHTIWQIQILETPDGTQMLSRHCLSSHGKCTVRHQRCQCLHWWCWRFLQ